MNILAEQLRHDAWANHAVVATFEQAPAIFDLVCYDGDPLRTRAQHLYATGQAFLEVLRLEPKYPEPPERLADLLAYGDATWAAIIAIVEPVEGAGFDAPYFVPWFKREAPMHVVISQVLAHSGQHRAELAWELARAGVSTGEIDFIQWLAGGRPAPGEPVVLDIDFED
ncbi:MAG: DinB family protein [Dehalococcoidia bacterium]|nr:DinB family protein [Dehalococcoidia bacterium]